MGDSNPAYFLKTPKNIINLLLSFGASSTACGVSTCSGLTLEFGVAAWLSAWAVELEEEAMLWSFSWCSNESDDKSKSLLSMSARRKLK